MSTIWWALGTFGLGTCLFGAAVLFLGWPIVLGFLETKVGRIVVLIGTAGIGLFIAYEKAVAQGAAKQRAKQEADNAAYLEEQRKNADAVSQLSDAALDRDLLTKQPK